MLRQKSKELEGAADCLNSNNSAGHIDKTKINKQRYVSENLKNTSRNGAQWARRST